MGLGERMSGHQRADVVVSASRIAEKLLCVAAKLTAPQGRENGERGDREGEQGSDLPEG